MPLNINREISQLRGQSGSNWLASALTQIQDSINQLGQQQASPANAPSTGVTAAQVQQIVAQALAASPAVQKAQNLQLGANGYPIVDISDVLHLNKSLGSINDDSQFQRVQNVSGNQTTSTSYQPGSISGQVASIRTIAVGIGATMTQVSSITASTSGGYVVLFVSAELFNSGGSGEAMQIVVYKGDNTGTVLYDTGVNGPYVVSGVNCLPWAIPGILDPSPAASQLYTIYAKIAVGTGSLSNILMTALNLHA